MTEPIATEPPPPVSKATVAGVAVFVAALVTIVVFFVPAADPPVAPDVHDPARIFAERCAICHGAQGEGRGKFPKVAGTGLTEDQIVEILSKGKGEMPKLEGTPEQRASLAKWLRSLKK